MHQYKIAQLTRPGRAVIGDEWTAMTYDAAQGSGYVNTLQLFLPHRFDGGQSAVNQIADATNFVHGLLRQTGRMPFLPYGPISREPELVLHLI